MAISDDLRWRIVWLRLLNSYSIRQISRRLYISTATVYRILDRFERTGTVSPNQATPKSTMLHEHDELLIVELVCETPSVYLRDIQHKLLSTTGTPASASTICRALKRMGFTRKRLQYAAMQRCDILRTEYMSEVSQYDAGLFVFVDESGCNRKNSMRRYGYSLRGYPARSFQFLSQGKRYSAIGIMTTTLLLDCYIVEGTVDGDAFYQFVQSSLLPHLLPFNGSNPNSIVILDNCSIHHVQEVVDLINSVGSRVLFLPPYSPDLMPIEGCFNKVKTYLKEHDLLVQANIDMKTLILAAFTSITSEDCIAWSKDCGYL